MKIDDVLKERAQTHGDFSEVAETAQCLKQIMHNCLNWDELACHNKEALEAIVCKMARILCGDADFLDHWKDVAGYAMLAHDLNKKFLEEMKSYPQA